MLDADTFLTTVYVAVDDFCKSRGIPPRALPGHRGPPPSLAPSEVVTLALVAQWRRFASERSFYRYADHHLRGAFPHLPTRPQFNRLVRAHGPLLAAFFAALAAQLRVPGEAYEALDCTAAVVRNCKRRGRGWLAGLVDIGWSNRLGWYEGFHVLSAVTPRGVLTGFGFGPASAKDQPLAESFLAARADPTLGAILPTVGALPPGQATQTYVTDTGFEGPERHAHWWAAFGAWVCSTPRRAPATRALRRWYAGVRQIIETAQEKLLDVLRLSSERPHTLSGFWARLNAMAALYNFCLLLNAQHGRPLLAFADLVDW